MVKSHASLIQTICRMISAIRVAQASRLLAKASPPSRTFMNRASEMNLCLRMTPHDTVRFGGTPVLPGALHAMFLRELHAALLNRYFQVFSALALLGGISAAVFAEDPNASAFFILQ